MKTFCTARAEVGNCIIQAYYCSTHLRFQLHFILEMQFTTSLALAAQTTINERKGPFIKYVTLKCQFFAKTFIVQFNISA